jgi:hypothetical protein
VGALCVGHLGDRRVQRLLLGGVFLHCGLQHDHLFLKRLEQLHRHFNCIKVAQYGVRRRLDGGGAFDGL